MLSLKEISFIKDNIMSQIVPEYFEDMPAGNLRITAIGAKNIGKAALSSEALEDIDGKRRNDRK